VKQLSAEISAARRMPGSERRTVRPVSSTEHKDCTAMSKRKDAERDYFKKAFDDLAIGGYIGDPSGRLAYAYIRVSSDDQAEEGRSGLPRQIAHCHEIATKRGYRIPWDLVFADDATGFEFEDRPSLAELRQEYKNGKRACAVVMEHIDRLSRNSDWHQGFLLDEMAKHGIEAVFWTAFHSRIERAVMGAVAQDAMELSIARMYQGQINKAKSGRVTSKKRTYGFYFVDSQGQAGDKARKDTHYAINKSEEPAVCMIYKKLGIEGMKLRPLAEELRRLYPPPGNYQYWSPTMIRAIVKNPVYKGEFVARRWQQVRRLQPTKDGLSMRYVTSMIERPREDWIIVPVPPIVSVELWELANRALQKNREMSSRNAKIPYLLTGLVKCSACGYGYIGHYKSNSPLHRYYRCNSQFSPLKSEREKIGCKQPNIPCRILDEAVWSVVSSVVLKPEILLQALDEHFANDGNADLLRQIAHIQETINGKGLEDEKNRKAYQAGAYDEHEFAALRRQIKEEVHILLAEKSKLESRVLTAEEVEEQKRFILALAKQGQDGNGLTNEPFEVKQRMIKLVVDHIELNVQKGTFSVRGKLNNVVSAVYSLNDIAFGSVGTSA
jgi:site-specific DNA recombinase